MTDKAYLRRAVYRHPLSGRKWLLCGGLMMFIWALSEALVRIDAMDGMVKAYINLARSQKTPFLEAARVIWETPAARKDWLNIAYLALIAIFALFALAVHRRWTPGFALIPLAGAVFLFHTSTFPLMQAFNLFEVLKAASCGLMAVGAGSNIACALRRRQRAARRLAEKKKKNKRLSHGTARTLIPERKNPGRKAPVR